MDKISSMCLSLTAKGDITGVQDILSKVDDPEKLVNLACKVSGDSPLILAAKNGHKDLVQYFIKMNAFIDHSNLDGKTALHEAAIYGHLDCINVLLERGANINALKRADWTPLMLACSKGNYEIVKKLAASNADIERKNKDGWNAFHITVREGHIEIAKFLLQKSPSCWSTISKNGRTPLHTAASHGRKQCVQLMLECCGYQPDMRDSCQCTPLMDALKFGHIDVASLLVNKHQADVFATDQLGRQSIHLASLSGSILSLEYLLEMHAVEVNTVTPSGLTPFHIAAKEGHVDALQFLANKGAMINAVDKNGRTALHFASAAAKVAIVKLLLEKYGMKCQTDSFNQTPCSLTLDPTTRRVFKELPTHSC